MKVSQRQAHVLANIDRVLPLVGKNGSERARYQLDGKECTLQVTGLTARKLISQRAGGDFRRLRVSDGPLLRTDRVGERQPPQAGSIEQIRACLSSPAAERR